MMADETIREIEDATRRVQGVLPGYPGLARPEDRRVADEALRRRVAALLEDLLQHLESVEVRLARQGLGAAVGRAGRVRMAAESLVDKTQLAAYAFSPFFSSDRIPEERLVEALNADAAIADALEPLSRMLGATLDSVDDLGALLDDVEALLARLDEHIEVRINTIVTMH